LLSAVSMLVVTPANHVAAQESLFFQKVYESGVIGGGNKNGKSAMNRLIKLAGNPADYVYGGMRESAKCALSTKNNYAGFASPNATLICYTHDIAELSNYRNAYFLINMDRQQMFIAYSPTSPAKPCDSKPTIVALYGNQGQIFPPNRLPLDKWDGVLKQIAQDYNSIMGCKAASNDFVLGDTLPVRPLNMPWFADVLGSEPLRKIR